MKVPKSDIIIFKLILILLIMTIGLITFTDYRLFDIAIVLAQILGGILWTWVIYKSVKWIKEKL